MAISVGSVEVDVVPNTQGIRARLQAALVPPASQIGDEVGRIIGQKIAQHITPAITQGINTGARAAKPAATRQGSDTGGAFARSLKARLEAAFRSMPKLNVGLNDTGVDADLARLRARLETLSGKTIGIDIDAERARAEAADIEERLRRIGAAHPNVAVRADTAAAIAQLRLLREQIDAVTAHPAHIRVETDGTFGQRLRAAVQQAEASLPNINIGADTTPAEVEIARLRAQLTSLRDVRIGVDMDVATATARVEAIQARLQALAASDADVAVRIDTGAAAAQLAVVRAQIAALDGKRINIRTDVSTAQATAALFQLSVALGAVAVIPALPIIAAGIGAITSAAVAAGAGVGALAAVAIPAFVGIAKAVQAQKAAQDAAATAAIKGGQANGQGAGKALQLAGAQQALATAHRNAARQIGQAEQGVADAVRNAAEANRQASQQVKQAELGVADAVEQAADRQRDAAQQVEAARQSLASAIQQAADQQRAAAERVAAAEQSLADAQRSSRQAQLDLTQARRDAAVELEDLSNRLADAQLSERDAALGVQEAQGRLNAVRASGSKASALQVAQAQLAYDQAVQRLKEQRLDTKRTAAEKKAADKAGVEGSDTVKSAQERVALAQRQVREQTADLAKAQRDAARQQQTNALEIAAAQGKVAESQRSAARAQEDSADAIAAAQGRLAEAQRNSSKVQGDGARSVGRAQGALAEAHASASDSISSAQRQIASASQQAAGGVDQAAVAQAKYQAALAKLTPSARDTFDAFVSLKGAFGDWSKSLQPAVMPIFTRALNGIKNSLPGLTPFVEGAVRAITKLQDKVSKGFDSPWWNDFRDDLAGSVEPAIVGLGVSFGRVFKGIAGIVQAFLPHMDDISTTMQRITGRFADWGTSLKGSPAFERFLEYAAENGPLVAKTIGDISNAFFEVARALSPLSGPVLEVLGAMARGVASIAVNLPWLIQGLYLAYIATRLWTLAMFLFNAVTSANPITLIVLAVVALVAAVIYAYKNFTWFREGVQAAWSGIKTAALAAWNGFLKPVLDGIVSGVQTAGRWGTWLWRTILKPAFEGIALAARILITVIAVILIAPLVIAFRLAGAIGTWLWKVAIGPAFRKIGDLGKWLYAKAIKPAFDGIGASGRWLYRVALKPAIDGIVTSFKFVGKIGTWLYRTALRPAFRGIAEVGRWLYDKAIKPAFDGIASRAKWLYDKALKPAFSRIKEAVRLVGVGFGKAKDAIKAAFGQVKSIVAKPVNFIIKWVYSKGIKAVWDKVADLVHLDHLDPAPQLLAAGGTVGNGFGPARPMRVNRPTAIVGEGNSQYPEYVIPTDPKYRNRAQALHAAAGTKLMAKGGILGPVGGAWDWTKDTVSDVVGKGIDWAKTGADLLVHPSKIWTKLVKPIIGKISKGVGAAGKWGEAIGKVPRRMVGGLKDLLVDAVKSMFAGGGGGAEWLKPASGKYGTKFGAAGRMWASGHHTGLDIAAAAGSAIKAVNDGTVSQVASGGPYGNHVEIDHGGGLSSFYAHMSRILTKNHKSVNRGKQIGKVGSTGNTTGPHLHLEARRNGRAVDPMPFLTGGGGGFTAQAAGAAQRYAKSILSNYGWGPSQFGPLKKLWNGESGWRWNALNKSSGAYGIPQCVDLETRILTRRGWLRHDEVEVGDETIGFNLHTGRSEWTSITDVYHYDKADMVTISGGDDWSARSTLGHRWLVVTDGGGTEFVIAADLRAGMRLRISDADTVQVTEIQPRGRDEIWCVSTGLGTWTAEQDSRRFLTGNSLPASKMRSAGADYRTNAKTQIKWGLGYIKGRPDYGSPARAYSKWQSRSPHWYDDGGYLQPGLNLAYNGTGRPEPVFTSTQANALTRIAMSPSAGGGSFEGDLYLDSGAFLGHVRGEVQQTMTDLATTLSAGRR